jgi:hypothetical protein
MTDFDPYAFIDNPEPTWTDQWVTADDIKGQDT